MGASVRAGALGGALLHLHTTMRLQQSVRRAVPLRCQLHKTRVGFPRAGGLEKDALSDEDEEKGEGKGGEREAEGGDASYRRVPQAHAHA